MVSGPETAPAKRPSRAVHLAGVIVELAFNIALPFLVYSLTKAQLGDVPALMVASAPPILLAQTPAPATGPFRQEPLPYAPTAL